MSVQKAVVFVVSSTSSGWFPGNMLCCYQYSWPLPNPVRGEECRAGCKILLPKQCIEVVSLGPFDNFMFSLLEELVEVLSSFVTVPTNYNCTVSFVVLEDNQMLARAWQWWQLAVVLSAPAWTGWSILLVASPYIEAATATVKAAKLFHSTALVSYSVVHLFCLTKMAYAAEMAWRKKGKQSSFKMKTATSSYFQNLLVLAISHNA